MKNFFTLLMLSNGTPMFCAGDEFLNTQGGNNNPYNQDNETSWLDWSRLESNRDIFRFFQQMIAFRKSRRMIGRSRYWREDIAWFGAEGGLDLSHASRSLAWRLKGERFGEVDLFVMVNAHQHARPFRVQEGIASVWHRIVDTNQPSPDDIAAPGEESLLSDLSLELADRSIIVLSRRPEP